MDELCRGTEGLRDGLGDFVGPSNAASDSNVALSDGTRSTHGHGIDGYDSELVALGEESAVAAFEESAASVRRQLELGGVFLSVAVRNPGQLPLHRDVLFDPGLGVLIGLHGDGLHEPGFKVANRLRAARVVILDFEHKSVWED